MKKKYNVIDLFCGCGGLSKGFEMAGYNIILGVDFNKPALETYEYNHKNSNRYMLTYQRMTLLIK